MLPQFNGADALSEKKPWNSPYAYCGGNPILRVDPTGFDEWDINSKGYIVNHKKTKAHDAFYMVDENNKRIDGKNITLKFGTVKSFPYQKTKSGIEYDIYKIRGDKNGTQAFEFFAQNTSVEWGQIKTGKGGKIGQNFLTTSHIKDEEYGGNDLFYKKLSNGYYIRERIHSHPNNHPYPSGLSECDGDMGNVLYFKKLYKNPNTIINKIYLPDSKSYIYYDEHSSPTDFGLEDNILNGITVKDN
jgi:hypothetical protein